VNYRKDKVASILLNRAIKREIGNCHLVAEPKTPDGRNFFKKYDFDKPETDHFIDNRKYPKHVILKWGGVKKFLDKTDKIIAISRKAAGKD
jgi:hypothetical protein